MRQEKGLPYLDDENRTKVYNSILQACSHLWSKGKIQEKKVLDALEPLINLTVEDPYFLAHLCSWIVKQQSKDLQVTVIYANSLSSADGLPFSAGSKYKKPNLRYISAAALLQLNPKLALRTRKLGSLKYSIPNILNKGTHFPTFMTTAINKYLKYREANIYILKGIKKSGLARIYRNLYRSVHMNPSDEAASILRWQQKDKKIDFKASPFDFKGLSHLQIANRIRKDRLSVLGVVGALPKVSPVIAVALLEQSTGNQALILRKTFEDQGVLKDKEVMSLFQEKISQAQTVVDRVENLAKGASEEVKKAMKGARAKVRKESMKGLGKIFLHLDFSGSMEDVITFAKKRASIIAETVESPEQNFNWGSFGTRGDELPLPEEFVQDAFKSVLFGRRADQGGTNAFLCYPMARKFQAEVDIFISDEGHNTGDLSSKIRRFHVDNPNTPKPKACAIVSFDRWNSRGAIQVAYEDNQIPVAILKPESLIESAGVVEAIKTAVKGPVAIIEDIMSTPLLKLPDYYYTL